MKKRMDDRNIFYPLIYLLLIVLAFLPPITTRPYPPQEIPQVIFQTLQNAITPNLYWWGWFLHAGTILVALIIAYDVRGKNAWFSVFFGFNYIVIACVQSTARTPDYGSVILPGPLAVSLLLGIMWISTVGSHTIKVSFQGVPRWRWYLLPLALLAFWSPLAFEGARAVPNFNPLLLLSSPDYGLSLCFMTPVLLFFLMLFFPQVPLFALRVTAFNGLLYGLFNLTHWASSDTLWLGVLHIPLLVLSPLALILSYKKKPTSVEG